METYRNRNNNKLNRHRRRLPFVFDQSAQNSTVEASKAHMISTTSNGAYDEKLSSEQEEMRKKRRTTNRRRENSIEKEARKCGQTSNH